MNAHATLTRAIAAAATASLLTLTLAGCASSTASRPTSATAAESAGASTRVQEASRLRQEGDINAALAELTMAIRDNPELTPAYMMLGEIHREQGDYQAAESAYREATELEPSNFDALYSHALVLQLLDRLVESVQQYLQALRIQPNDHAANLNLATAYLSLDEPGQALRFAQRAVRIRPEDGPSRVNLGAVYAAQGLHAEAVREYEAAAEYMDPTPELLLNMADSLGKIGRHREMAITLERLIEIEPSSQAWERLGSARFRLREYEAALSCFRRAADLDPRHYPALNGVGVCLLNQYLLDNKRDNTVKAEALNAFRRSLQVREDQPRIKELLTRYG